MRIGGLQKFSLIDYPGKTAAVIFTQGCNFRCPYCYNPELAVSQLFKETIPESKIFTFLKKRQGQLEGVVVTGGEPTIQKDLISFLDKIKLLGYFIKLDTNGNCPEVLKKVIHLRLVNYIAMDVKAPLEKYSRIAGIKVDTDRLKESIDIILNSGLQYQLRTTLVKPLCSAEDLPKIASLINGAKRYQVQKFMPDDKILNKRFLDDVQYTDQEINELERMWCR